MQRWEAFQVCESAPQNCARALIGSETEEPEWKADGDWARFCTAGGRDRQRSRCAWVHAVHHAAGRGSAPRPTCLPQESVSGPVRMESGEELAHQLRRHRALSHRPPQAVPRQPEYPPVRLGGDRRRRWNYVCGRPSSAWPPTAQRLHRCRCQSFASSPVPSSSTSPTGISPLERQSWFRACPSTVVPLIFQSSVSRAVYVPGSIG